VPNLILLKRFLKHPREVGALAASSKALSRAVAEAANLQDAETVVEFGPGTGVITEMVLERLPQDATFMAIETAPEFVEILRNRFPDLNVINDSAVNTRKHLEEVGKDFCDSVVSGLPWAVFDDALQDALMDTLLNVLRPGGRFSAFMYTSALLLRGGRRFRRILGERFSTASVAEVVWANLPPALVLCADK